MYIWPGPGWHTRWAHTLLHAVIDGLCIEADGQLEPCVNVPVVFELIIH